MEFKGWQKTPRLFRDMIITEKIDGTNCAVIVDGDGNVGAQSRNRIITPEGDSYGFLSWVNEHSAELSELLGPGHHFGEWWGHKIQRGYGLNKGDRRFSLFNVNRYESVNIDKVPGLGLVPVLYEGPFSTSMVNYVLKALGESGSWAAPGFMRPEGVIVYHSALNGVFKVTLDNDGVAKSEVK